MEDWGPFMGMGGIGGGGGLFMGSHGSQGDELEKQLLKKELIRVGIQLNSGWELCGVDEVDLSNDIIDLDAKQNNQVE